MCPHASIVRDSACRHKSLHGVRVRSWKFRALSMRLVSPWKVCPPRRLAPGPRPRRGPASERSRFLWRTIKVCRKSVIKVHLLVKLISSTPSRLRPVTNVSPHRSPATHLHARCATSHRAQFIWRCPLSVGKYQGQDPEPSRSLTSDHLAVDTNIDIDAGAASAGFSPLFSSPRLKLFHTRFFSFWVF